MKPRCLCIGDIHGRVTALNEVLDSADFRNDKDRLITLGDVCDGGDDTRGVIDRLLQIEDRTDILGNHDVWFNQWVSWNREISLCPQEYYHWQSQGGIWTERSYDFDVRNVPIEHRNFLNGQVPYYIDDDNRIFVHGGFNPNKPIGCQTVEYITWDRTLIKKAKYRPIKGYNHVFVGHSSTMMFKEKMTTIAGGRKTVSHVTITHPVTWHNLTMCDCGGGWTGRLAMVDVSNPDNYYLSSFQTANPAPSITLFGTLCPTSDVQTQEDRR
jgi:serine/threonine protein phosphatase 1